MGYLDYYSYQAKARGVRTLEDIRRIAEERAYLYDRIVLPWLPPNKAARVGELACGHGSFLWWLRQRGYQEVIGIDSSPEQIALAAQTGAATRLMEVNRWLEEQPEGKLQALVGIDLIEHISKDDFMNLLEASYRALAADGHLILRYPNGDSPFVGRNLFNDITHIWTYTTNCLETLGRMHRFSRFRFVDESTAAIRDHRGIKVPLCRLSLALLKALTHAATKERIAFWSPHIWACLQK